MEGGFPSLEPNMNISKPYSAATASLTVCLSNDSYMRWQHMSYIKKFISTLATFNYYSSSNDRLDDHLMPNDLGLTSENIADKHSTNSKEDLACADNYLGNELVVEGVIAEMNNSYSSSQRNI